VCACVCECVSARECACVYVCMCVYTCVHRRGCVGALVRGCVGAWVVVRACLRTCVCACLCIPHIRVYGNGWEEQAIGKGGSRIVSPSAGLTNFEFVDENAHCRPSGPGGRDGAKGQAIVGGRSVAVSQGLALNQPGSGPISPAFYLPSSQEGSTRFKSKKKAKEKGEILPRAFNSKMKDSNR